MAYKVEVEKLTDERRIDALVAEKVLGWHWVREDFPPGWTAKNDGTHTWPLAQLREPSHPKSKLLGDEHKHWRPGGRQTWASWDSHLPHYTTNLESSKKLRTYLAEKFNNFDLSHDAEGWFCAVYNKPHDGREFPFAGSADTEEMAVALCALKSVGIDPTPSPQ